jgi:hypothetical protein
LFYLAISVPKTAHSTKEEEQMTITITITDPTPTQIAALFGTAGGPVTPEVAAAKTTRASKPKEEPVAEPKTSDPVADADVPSLDDVRDAAQALVKANGREALAERLAQFGAANLSALPEDKRAAFIAG